MKCVEYLRKMILGDRKYRDLFENNRDGIYITTVDGTIVDVNNTVLKLTGYTRKEFFKMHSTHHYVNPMDRVRFQREIKKKGFVKNFLVPMKKKSGHQFFCMLTSTALRDNRNRIIGYHGIIHDVTEIKEREQTILESEKKFRDLFESSPDPIFVESFAGKVLDVNRAACRMHGTTREKLVGKHFTGLIPEAYRKFIKGNFENFISGKQGSVESYSLGSKNRVIPVEIRAGKIMYEGNPAVLLHVRDISERKKAENSLRQSHEQLRQLAAHLQNVKEEESSRFAKELHDELGQTVTVLKFELTFIENKLKSGSFSKEDIMVLRQKVNSLIEMVNASIDSVRRISVNLHPLILDNLGLLPAIEWFAGDFSKRTGILCTTRFFLDGERIFSKELAVAVFRIIQEAFTNILRHSNATMVRLFIIWKNTHFSVRISDNGRGFHISRDEEHRTSGIIGMKERALSIGGALRINSYLKKGTIITLTIPIQ